MRKPIRFRIKFPLRFESLDTLQPMHIKLAAFGFVIAVGILALVGFAAFTLSLTGGDITKIENYEQMDLSTAIDRIQGKSLFAKVFWINSDIAMAGKVIKQDPAPGFSLREGGYVEIYVGREAIKASENMPDYVGKSYDQAVQDIRRITRRPDLEISQPIYSYSSAEKFSIIDQSPLPGNSISTQTQFKFVVSLGPLQQVKVPNFTNMTLEAAVKALSGAKIVADFSSKAREGSEKAGVILSQFPAAGDTVASGSRIQLTFTEPEMTGDLVFGLLKLSLPSYPFPVNIEVSAQYADGSVRTIYYADHPGASFTLPYLLPENTILIVKSKGTEISRQTVSF